MQVSARSWGRSCWRCPQGQLDTGSRRVYSPRRPRPFQPPSSSGRNGTLLGCTRKAWRRTHSSWKMKKKQRWVFFQDQEIAFACLWRWLFCSLVCLSVVYWFGCLLMWSSFVYLFVMFVCLPVCAVCLLVCCLLVVFVNLTVSFICLFVSINMCSCSSSFLFGCSNIFLFLYLHVRSFLCVFLCLCLFVYSSPSVYLYLSQCI